MKQRFAGMDRMKLCLAFVFFALCGCATTPATRPMKLVVTGEPGTMFTAKYKADGILQEQTALMPGTVAFQARNVEWEVTRPSGDGEFRVDLMVGELKRLSTTSSGHRTIRGALKYSANQESYWAQPVD